MKKSECLHLAYYNVKTFKKSGKQYFSSLLLVSFFLMLFFSLSIVTNQMYNNLISDSISTNYMDIFLDLDATGNEIQNDSVNLLNQIKGIDGISLGSKYALLDLSKNDEKIYSEDIDYVFCTINGQKYMGKNDYSFDFLEDKTISNHENKELFSVDFSICILDMESSMWTDNSLEEYDQKYTSRDVFICGRPMENKNEIVLSDYMLNRFGITDNYNTLLNQEISFYVKNYPVVEQYKIVGILDANYYRVDANCDKSQILIAGDPSLYAKNNISFLTQEIGLGDFANSSTILNLIDEKYVDCYRIPVNIYYFEMIDKFNLVCKRIISVFMGILVVAMFIKLVSNVYINRKSRTYYYGILKTLGMDNIAIFRVCAYELLIILFFCMGIAVVLSFLTLKVMQYFMMQLTGYYITVSVGVLGAAVFVTGFVVACITIVVSVVSNTDLLRKNAIEIIKS